MTTAQQVPTFDELLNSAKRSASHLEMRDGYMRSDPLFTAWLAGHRDDPEDRRSWWRPWFDVVAATVARGVEVRRARIVSVPVSEYIRFEYDITFQNVAVGECVRWLPRRDASRIALPGNDFWLVDDQLVLFNHFTGEGERSAEGREVSTEHSVITMCGNAFEEVWKRGVDHDAFKI